ncbi:Uncharacterised protein [Pseudomonas fluorescens]|uniref:Uncharacterized protein n=1 Tax=Pseudomonas fluorescens TaxID=294 RepID=A0A3S4SSF2_PSEFL|nr:Uncharacterised protein [Pseudomonas fluorescens]
MHRRERPGRLWTRRNNTSGTPTLDSAKVAQVGVTPKHPPISPLSLWERELTEVSGVMHRRERPGRLWTRRNNTSGIPTLDPAKVAQVGVTPKHLPISPLSLWERELTEVSGVMHRRERPGRLWTRRNNTSGFPTLDSAKVAQVGVTPKHPPISSLSLWERELTEVSGVMHRRERPGRLWTRRNNTSGIPTLDSAKVAQVGVTPKHLPISPLSLWERVRVR